MSVHVLLIEDAEDIGLLVREILEDEDFCIEVAADGEAGLAALRERPPDVVLLDMSLPKVSGWDLLPRLRAEHRDIPVIALTAHAMQTDRERAASLGCTEYLSKPFEIDELVDVVRRYAGRE